MSTAECPICTETVVLDVKTPCCFQPGHSTCFAQIRPKDNGTVPCPFCRAEWEGRAAASPVVDEHDDSFSPIPFGDESDDEDRIDFGLPYIPLADDISILETTLSVIERSFSYYEYADCERELVEAFFRTVRYRQLTASEVSELRNCRSRCRAGHL